MKLGVVGLGNMGSAIIKGYIGAGARPEDIYAVGHRPDKTAAFAEETGINACENISQLAKSCQAVMIAVKPKDVNEVLGQLASSMTKDLLIISIAAGKSIEDLKAGMKEAVHHFDFCLDDLKIIRVMPNTPAMVGEGMSALCRSACVTDSEFASVMDIFAGIGRASEVKESMMDAVTGVSGSGPAYVYMFIEALADGAVMNGMPRAQAYEFAAQTVLGSAKMVLETGQHPGELKDAVCSPSGTTIEAVAALEAGGLRSTVISAVSAACEKSRNM